ncbi:MAG: AAA family ATPase [Geminicoccaceae bacterium]
MKVDAENRSQDIEGVNGLVSALRREIGKAVVGQDEAVDLLLMALLCRGHVLLEGVPGTAKTLLVQSFARSLALDFGRIQFTPDLMPGDVLGTNLFNFESSSFVFSKGPIFTEILLADEINRTPPKTQAALLQAMHERVVTIDNGHYELGDGFMVVATQNSIEQQGTYALPEAQLDRFLFKHVLPYPSEEQERAIVAMHGRGNGMPDVERLDIQKVCDLARLRDARAVVAEVKLDEILVNYLVDLVRNTRRHEAIHLGASPRAAASLAAAARAAAALDGRDYVIPDDIKRLAKPVLCHRILLDAGAEIDGLENDAVINEIVEATPAPR